jgi:Uma2 family endonuclease
MTAAVKQIALVEYLETERQSEERHEFFAGHVRAMAGASERHNLIASNANRAIAATLEKTDCRVYQSDMRVRTRSTLYCYPDVVVACGQRQFEGDRQDILLNPVLLIEVLSDSTEAYDRGQKFEHYQSIASLRTYVLIAQDRVHVDHFEKQPSGDWLLKSLSSLDSPLAVSSLGISVPVVDFYKKVEFTPTAG